MKILISGSNGYLASRLIPRLKGNKLLFIDKKILRDITDPDFYDRFKKFKPDLIYHLAADTDVQESIRNPRQYIKDIVQANILALESEKLNEVYNIGTGEELTTEGVFEVLKDFFGYNKEFERLPARTVDPLRFGYDISKAKKLLKYEPKYTFKEGITDWFKK